MDGELVDQAVGERKAVGSAGILQGPEQAGDDLVIVGDEALRSGGMEAPFTRGAAPSPTG